MCSKHLKVMNDFEKKDLKVGNIVPSVDGDFKIIDLNYRNQFGTFILCEKVAGKKELKPESSWNIVSGVPVNDENPYEIVGTIHIPGDLNALVGSGFYIRNHVEDKVVGLSNSETWEIIYKYGARNAEASRSLFPPLQTKIICTNEELPSFESVYWKTPVLDKQGVPHTPLSKLVLKEVENAIRVAITKEEEIPINTEVVNETSKDVVQKPVKVSPNVVQSLSKEAQEAIKNIPRLIANSEKIVVLTGAGISTDSGIPDYRSSVDSLWKKNPFIMADLNQRVFETEPESFWNSYYTLIKESLYNFTPKHTHESLAATIKAIPTNDGHQFFSWLEKQLNMQITILTQNVDGLHQKADSKKVVEFHGNIFECICPSCPSTYSLFNVLTKSLLPKCMCGTVLRPNVVFFGDAVHHFNESINEVEQADLIFVVGTSLEVYPFNQLIYHKNEDAKLIFINGSKVEIKAEFDITVLGNITEICNRLKEELNQFVY